jgi:hypothetical protein
MRILAVVMVTGLVVTACSASIDFSIGGESVENAATKLIESEIADAFGEPLTADCPAVPEPDIGTEFSCTADTADGRTLLFTGVIDREDHIDVNSTNVLRADTLPGWERAGAEVILGEAGVEATIDCGEASVVLVDTEMTCTATSDDGVSIDVIYTIEDPESGDFLIRTN